MTGKTPWPNLLADLEAKRDAISSAIDIIRTHFVGDVPGEMPASPIVGANGHATRKTRRTFPKKQAASRTGERRRAQAPQTIHARAVAYGPRIVELLTTRGAMKMATLAAQLQLSQAGLSYHLRKLIAAKQIAATGQTSARVFHLPGKSPAKEGL